MLFLLSEAKAAWFRSVGVTSNLVKKTRRKISTAATWEKCKESFSFFMDHPRRPQFVSGRCLVTVVLDNHKMLRQFCHHICRELESCIVTIVVTNSWRSQWLDTISSRAWINFKVIMIHNSRHLTRVRKVWKVEVNTLRHRDFYHSRRIGETDAVTLLIFYEVFPHSSVVFHSFWGLIWA